MCMRMHVQTVRARYAFRNPSYSTFSLFMIPAAQMNMVAGQIATLELSVLYSIHGVEYVDKVLNELLSSSTSSPGLSLLPSINGIIVMFCLLHSTNIQKKSTRVYTRAKTRMQLPNITHRTKQLKYFQISQKFLGVVVFLAGIKPWRVQ